MKLNLTKYSIISKNYFKKSRYLKSSRVIISYLILQAVTATLSIVRIPISIKSIGISDFGILVVCLSLWSLFTISAESIRRETQVKKALNLDCKFNFGNLLFDVGVISILIAIISSANRIMNTFDIRVFDSILLIFGVAAIVHSITSYLRGLLEGANLVGVANSLNTIGYIAAFPIFLLAAKSNNLELIAISFAISFELPGLIYFIYHRKIKLKAEMSWQFTPYLIVARMQWFALQTVDLLSYSIDPFLVALILGAADAAEYGVYQKFVLIATAVTVALSPLQAISSVSKADHLNAKTLQHMNFWASSFVIFTVYFFAPQIIVFISDGQFSVQNSIMIAILANAYSGIFTSSLIQQTNTGRGLRIRVLATSFATIIGLVFTVTLMPSLGIAAAFWSSSMSLSLTYFILKLWKYRSAN